ncbi:Outer membrane protein beta-barrel domain protein [compost metagenome]
MKKFLLLCSFFFGVHTANAQFNPSRYDFRLGLTACPTFGMISAEEGQGKGTNLGFAYGLMADFNFAERYSLLTGLTITSVNGKSKEINAMPYHAVVSSTGAIEYNLKYKFQYIEIPLAIKLKTAEIGGVMWFGQFGLANGFRIKSRQDAYRGTTELAYHINSASWTRFYRAGLLIGGGAEYALDSHTAVMAGLTLNNGLSNISTEQRTVKNHYVALNIGVFF